MKAIQQRMFFRWMVTDELIIYLLTQITLNTVRRYIERV
jgi:hypothetical protein